MQIHTMLRNIQFKQFNQGDWENREGTLRVV